MNTTATKSNDIRWNISCCCNGKKEDIVLIKREETVMYKCKEVHYMAEFYHCNFCGEDFETGEMLDRNLDAAREAYRLMEQGELK